MDAPTDESGNYYNPTNVLVADIDGDGRFDYCIMADDGNVKCKRNGGTSDEGSYWQGFTKDTEVDQWTHVFDGQDKGNKFGVKFGPHCRNRILWIILTNCCIVDINGDFRSDWLWVGDTGEVFTFINRRGDGAGDILPYWWDHGQTHAGTGTTTGSSYEHIKFARIYGSGRADVGWLPLPVIALYHVRSC
jgi:hypothetical protein